MESGAGKSFKVYLSAYPDNITVFISEQNDGESLNASIKQYEKAPTAKVNWAK